MSKRFFGLKPPKQNGNGAAPEGGIPRPPHTLEKIEKNPEKHSKFSTMMKMVLIALILFIALAYCAKARSENLEVGKDYRGIGAICNTVLQIVELSQMVRDGKSPENAIDEINLREKKAVCAMAETEFRVLRFFPKTSDNLIPTEILLLAINLPGHGWTEIPPYIKQYTLIKNVGEGGNKK